MSQIQALFNLDWVTVIIGIFVIMLGVKEIITIIQFFLKQFGIHTKIDDEKEKIEHRFVRLEQHDDWQYQKINEMSSGIEDIKSMLVKSDEKQNLTSIATCGSMIRDLHKELIEKGSVTNEELTTFERLYEVYVCAGGNSIVHNKLYPEVMALPIKE